MWRRTRLITNPEHFWRKKLLKTAQTIRNFVICYIVDWHKRRKYLRTRIFIYVVRCIKDTEKWFTVSDINTNSLRWAETIPGNLCLFSRLGMKPNWKHNLFATCRGRSLSAFLRKCLSTNLTIALKLTNVLSPTYIQNIYSSTSPCYNGMVKFIFDNPRYWSQDKVVIVILSFYHCERNGRDILY